MAQQPLENFNPNRAVDPAYSKPALLKSIQSAIDGRSARLPKMTGRFANNTEKFAQITGANTARNSAATRGLVTALDLIAVQKGDVKILDLPEVHMSRAALRNSLVGAGEGILSKPQLRGEDGVNSLSQHGGWEDFQKTLADSTEDMGRLMEYARGMLEALYAIIRPEIVNDVTIKQALQVLHQDIFDTDHNGNQSRGQLVVNLITGFVEGPLVKKIAEVSQVADKETQNVIPIRTAALELLSITPIGIRRNYIASGGSKEKGIFEKTPAKRFLVEMSLRLDDAKEVAEKVAPKRQVLTSTQPAGTAPELIDDIYIAPLTSTLRALEKVNENAKKAIFTAETKDPVDKAKASLAHELLTISSWVSPRIMTNILASMKTLPKDFEGEHMKENAKTISVKEANTTNGLDPFYNSLKNKSRDFNDHHDMPLFDNQDEEPLLEQAFADVLGMPIADNVVPPITIPSTFYTFFRDGIYKGLGGPPAPLLVRSEKWNNKVKHGTVYEKRVLSKWLVSFVSGASKLAKHDFEQNPGMAEVAAIKLVVANILIRGVDGEYEKGKAEARQVMAETLSDLFFSQPPLPPILQRAVRYSLITASMTWKPEEVKTLVANAFDPGKKRPGLFENGKWLKFALTVTRYDQKNIFNVSDDLRQANMRADRSVIGDVMDKTLQFMRYWDVMDSTTDRKSLSVYLVSLNDQRLAAQGSSEGIDGTDSLAKMIEQLETEHPRLLKGAPKRKRASRVAINPEAARIVWESHPLEFPEQVANLVPVVGRDPKLQVKGKVTKVIETPDEDGAEQIYTVTITDADGNEYTDQVPTRYEINQDAIMDFPSDQARFKQIVQDKVTQEITTVALADPDIPPSIGNLITGMKGKVAVMLEDVNMLMQGDALREFGIDSVYEKALALLPAPEGDHTTDLIRDGLREEIIKLSGDGGMGQLTNLLNAAPDTRYSQAAVDIYTNTLRTIVTILDETKILSPGLIQHMMAGASENVEGMKVGEIKEIGDLMSLVASMIGQAGPIAKSIATTAATGSVVKSLVVADNERTEEAMKALTTNLLWTPIQTTLESQALTVTQIEEVKRLFVTTIRNRMETINQMANELAIVDKTRAQKLREELVRIEESKAKVIGQTLVKLTAHATQLIEIQDSVITMKQEDVEKWQQFVDKYRTVYPEMARIIISAIHGVLKMNIAINLPDIKGLGVYAVTIGKQS